MFKKFLTTLSLCAIFFTGCIQKNLDTAKTVKLEAEMVSQPEGVESFNPQDAVLTVSANALQCSAIKLSNASGDLDGVKLTARAADKTWCVARMSSTFLSLTIVKNPSESQRQTVVTVEAESEGKVAGTYELLIIQNGMQKEPSEDDSKSKAEILQFMIQGQISSKITSSIINVTMPSGTDLTKLIAVYEISQGAVCTPENIVEMDYSKPVTFTVVSQDGTNTRKYTVVVSTLQEGGGAGPEQGLTRNPDYRPFDYVEVPAGSFKLGVDPSGKWPDRVNSHLVNISALVVGKYEVTQQEFQQIMGYNTSRDRSDEQLPVHTVTLYEAMLYCNKLSEKDGLEKVYTFSDEVWGDSNEDDIEELFRATVTRNEKCNGWRLPTNAEWEYVAKGGPNKDLYHYSGGNNIDEIGWFEENSLLGEKTKVRCVGTKKPNSLGIYDMTGNIEEYTGEWYGSLEYPSDSEETDPWGYPEPLASAASGDNLVYSRGGNFDTYADVGCVVNRRILNGNVKNDSFFPGGDTWHGVIGFRVFRYAEPRK